MKKIFFLLFFLFSFFSNRPTNAMDCWATRQVPAPDQVTLSNGARLTLPARACHFDVRGLIGEADLKALGKELQAAGLHPISVAGKGVLLVSFYFYRQSDMGTFNEFYVVTPASRQPHGGFDTIKSLWQALRANPDHAPSEQLIFYHLYVRSNDHNGALASREVWGIDSQWAQIEEHVLPKNRSVVRLTENHSLVMSWQVKKMRWPYTPMPMDIHLNAGGFIEQLTLSPVLGEGKVRLQRARELPQLAPNSSLAQLLASLQFRPQLMQWGQHLQAIQYAPQSILLEDSNAAKNYPK